MDELGPTDLILLDRFRLDRRGGCLFRLAEKGETVPVALGSRAVNLLRLLVEHKGQLVSKDAIMGAVWPGRAVEESNLNVHIATLRRVLDANQGQGSCIQTLPGRGYCFVGAVRRFEAEAIGAMPSPTAIALPGKPVRAGKRLPTAPAIDSFQRRRPSIAVLPFVDQAAETATSYFSDGLVEDIISALACLPELVVISRSSTLRYRGSTPDPRQVRRDLRVRYMLSGSVRRALSSTGDKVRLSAELTDCESGARIWSDRFAGEAADLFALQDDLSARVVATIAPQVQESELRRVLRKRPESLDAYECVLRGLDFMYRSDDDRFFPEALKMFQRAMTLDPNYGTAHALAANWYSVRINQGLSADVRADYGEADRLSRLALTLDRFDPLALSLCGHVRAFLFRDYDHALELFDRALAANPSSAIAWLRSSATFSYIGETREARRRAEIGLRLSPYDAHVFYSYAIMAVAAYAAGDYADAAQWARRSAALNSRFTANLRFLAASLAASGKVEEAREAAQALLRIDPKFSARRFAEGHAFKDPEKRRLFGEHLVLAGLPE